MADNVESNKHKGNQEYLPDVSPAVYKAVHKCYPEIRMFAPLCNLLHHLLYAPYLDPQVGSIVIDRNTLAHLRGLEDKQRNRNVRGDQSHELFLKHFGRAVPLTVFKDSRWWDGYDSRRSPGNQTRSATITKWPKPIEDAIKRDLTDPSWMKGRIHLFTGQKLTDRFLRSFFEGPEGEATHRHEKVNDLVEHLNQLPSNYFYSQLARNFDAIQKYAKSQESLFQKHILRLLRTLYRSPVPQYRTKHGYRIFAAGHSIQSMPSAMRPILMPKCIELDLRAAQLAIVSKLWDLKTLRAALEYENVWEELMITVQFPPGSISHKKLLKKSIYSFVNGMKRTDMARALSGNAAKEGVQIQSSSRVIKRLFGSPILAGIEEARSRAYQEIEDNGGAEDAFGLWHSSDGLNSHLTFRDIKSVFSRVCSSYEFALLEPAASAIIEAQNTTKPQVSLVLWQHDGFSIRVAQKKRHPLHIKKLQSLVLHRAEQLGIPTSLQVDYQPYPTGS